MKVKTATMIEPGELVANKDDLYMAVAFVKGMSCTSQCAFFDPKRGRCSGYCLRWDNWDEVVFRRILPMAATKADTEVVSTPDLIEAELTRRRQDQKLEALARRSIKENT